MTLDAPEPVNDDWIARFTAAREALDALSGPERVEVLRHYGSSAKRAVEANESKAKR